MHVASTLIVVACGLFCILGGTAWADRPELCTPRANPGDVCLLDVEKANATQFAVGMAAVHCKRSKLEKKSSAKLKKYLKHEKRQDPVPLGEGGPWLHQVHQG